jgi:protein TonB
MIMTNWNKQLAVPRRQLALPLVLVAGPVSKNQSQNTSQAKNAHTISIAALLALLLHLLAFLLLKPLPSHKMEIAQPSRPRVITIALQPDSHTTLVSAPHVPPASLHTRPTILPKENGKSVVISRQQATPSPVTPPSLRSTAHTSTSPAPVVSMNPRQTASAAVSAQTAVTPSPEESVTEARADADYLHNPAPPYPDFAKARGWNGQVRLKVRVLASGHPEQVIVVHSSGHPLLDEAAQHAVQRWVFIPAKHGNSAIDSWVQVPVDFKLGDSSS